MPSRPLLIDDLDPTERYYLGGPRFKNFPAKNGGSKLSDDELRPNFGNHPPPPQKGGPLKDDILYRDKGD